MIYFFKKLHDDSYFALDDEKAATATLKRRDFRDKFEYVGKSDGSTYKKVMEEVKKISKAEKSLLDTPIEHLSEEQKKKKIEIQQKIDAFQLDNIQQRAFDAELEVARNNTDKTPPNHKSKYGLDGGNLENNAILNTLDVMK